MKTIITVLCILFCFVSPALADDNDFNGADGIVWQQHVSSLPFKLVKYDEMVMADGSVIDVCYRDNNPTMESLKGIKFISYLFKDYRFIGIIYELRDDIETIAFISALINTMGSPDKVTPDTDKPEDKHLKILWVRKISMAFAMTATHSVLLGERAAIAEVLKKWGTREKI
jgi:hypothetical protein